MNNLFINEDLIKNYFDWDHISFNNVPVTPRLNGMYSKIVFGVINQLKAHSGGLIVLPINKSSINDRRDILSNLTSYKDILGVAIGTNFKDVFRDDIGNEYNEDSCTIEILKVCNDTLRKVAKELCRKLHLQSAFIRFYDGTNPEYIYGTWEFYVSYNEKGKDVMAIIDAKNTDDLKNRIGQISKKRDVKILNINFGEFERK